MTTLSDLIQSTPTTQYILITSCVALVAFLVLRNLLASKYRLPPGPRGLPVIGHMHLLGKAPHQSLMRLAQKYGKIIILRLGVHPTVVVSSPELAREVLKVQDQHLASRPALETGKILAYDNQSTSLFPHNETWRFMRKIISTEVVSAKRIEQSKVIRREELLNTLEEILSDGQKGSLVNFDDKLTTLVLNQTTRFQLQEKFLDLGGVETRMHELAKMADNFYSGILASHRNEDGSYLYKEPYERDIVDVLCAYQQEHPEEITDERIKAGIQDLIIASSSTSTSTMLWALAEIMRHPDILLKIQDELDTVVGKERLVQESDISKLDCLLAMIKENFRLHPTGPLLIPHQSDHVDVKTGGYDVPAQTRVLVNVYAIGRDPLVWEDPLEFSPDRFKGSQIDVRGQHFELLPFGAGRRMCVGFNLALTTVEMVIAQILHTCDVSLPDGVSPEDMSMEEVSGFTVTRAEALKLRVHVYHLLFMKKQVSTFYNQTFSRRFNLISSKLNTSY